MKLLHKSMIFCLILFVGLTAVSAADIINDDSSAVAVETPQIEQTNAQTNAQNVQQKQLEDEQETTSNDVEISQNVTITSSNVANYNNKNWTVNQGVTVNGTTGVPLTNVAINVVGDYVTLNNLEINTNNATKLIDATGTNNLTITNSRLTLANNGLSTNSQAIGIDLTNAKNTSISGTTLNVRAPSQGVTWKNDTGYWYSTLDVSGILVYNSENIVINQNIIHITNTTEKYAYTTMPAITIKSGSTNINVTFNTITSGGAHFVYGIMMNDGVTNVAIKNNTIGVQDVLYVAGIDASTATDSVVSGNHITATSTGQTTYDSSVGEESLAYGIISDTYTTGNQNNRICSNTITATANTIYGIEVYKGNNIIVCSNNIYGNGNKTMGVAFAHTNNSKIINNFMRLTGTTIAHHTFYEEVTPVNAGIIFTNQSNGNLIQGNDIEITAYSDNTARTINLQNSTTANITGNALTAINTVYSYGNDTIIQDNLCSGINIGENNGVNPYNCDCGCMNSNTLSQNAVLFSKSKIIKQNPTETENILIIDDNNYRDYGRMYGSTYQVNGNSMLPNTNVILNVSFDKVMFFNYTENNINFIGSTFSGTSPMDNLQTVIVQGNVSNCYAPNSHIQLDIDNTHIINSTFSTAVTTKNNITFINNTIIKTNSSVLPYQLYLIGHNYTVKDNYMVFVNKVGYSGLIRDDIIVENNRPFYENPEMLKNSNYNTYFDENNNLKSEYENKALFATENITNPVIISNKVTLSSIRGYGGYSNITLMEGSDNSIIEDSIINKITINGASNININNNKLLSDDSVIEVINSAENIIENNTINTKNTNTITFDADSIGTTVKHNELIANELTGDKSVQSTSDNTIEDNTPVYIPAPELKVDTTEFTIGSNSSIKASIYLDDEVASDISRGKVAFKVNGKTLKDANGKVIYAKIVNGTATIENYEIPSSWNKEGLTISAVYSGSSQCEALRSQESNMTITAPEPVITSDNATTASVGSTIQLNAKITAGDTPINYGKVVFKVNGKTVKDSNGKVIYALVDSNGEVSVNYTIPENMKAKDYTISITFISPKGKLTKTSTLTVTA